MHAGDTGRTSKKRHTPLQVSPSQHHSRWNYSPQHWETINLIFKLSALKDKLWMPRLPGWTPAQHPWCQASPAQPHPPQLQSEPGLPGDPRLAGTSPAGHCCKRQSVGHSSLLQQLKLCPLCPSAGGTATSGGGTAWWFPSRASGNELRPTARPAAAREARWNDVLQPQPSSRAKLFSFSTSKCTSGYNTVHCTLLRWIQRQFLMVTKTRWKKTKHKPNRNTNKPLQNHIPSSPYLSSAHLRSEVC